MCLPRSSPTTKPAMLINVTGSITFSTLSQDPFKLVILVEAHTRKIRHRLALSDLEKTKKKNFKFKNPCQRYSCGVIHYIMARHETILDRLDEIKGKENSRQAWTGPQGLKSQSWACHHSRIISAHWSLPSFVLAGNLSLNEFNNSIMIVWCLLLPLRVWTLKGGKNDCKN